MCTSEGHFLSPHYRCDKYAWSFRFLGLSSLSSRHVGFEVFAALSVKCTAIPILINSYEPGELLLCELLFPLGIISRGYVPQ
jgi:hypothetical protein